MKIYCARQFSGHHFIEIAKYYKELGTELKSNGFIPLIPLSSHKIQLESIEFIRPDSQFKSPELSTRATMKRDQFLVKQADIFLFDMSTIVDDFPVIGGFFELAWAYDNGLHTLIVKNQNYFNDHPFIKECSDVMFDTMEEVMEYLKNYFI